MPGSVLIIGFGALIFVFASIVVTNTALIVVLTEAALVCKHEHSQAK